MPQTPAAAPAVYDALLQGPFDVLVDRCRGALALADLVEVVPGSRAAVRLSELRADKGRSAHRSEEDDPLSSSPDPVERVVGLLRDGREHHAAALLQEVHGAEAVVRTLLRTVHSYEDGSVESDLLLEMALRPAPAPLVVGALSGLELLRVQGLTPSPAFLRFFRATTHTRTVVKYSSLAPLSVLEAGLGPDQEEVYYALVLDGTEFHEAEIGRAHV